MIWEELTRYNTGNINPIRHPPTRPPWGKRDIERGHRTIEESMVFTSSTRNKERWYNTLLR
jgi:hypothetical protein